MVAVTSLTAEKILELAATWAQVAEAQEQANALIAQLQTTLEQNSAALLDLNENILPEFEGLLNANANELSNLNEVALVDLQESLEGSALALENLNTVVLPTLEANLASGLESIRGLPQVYRQPDEPTNPDEDDRDLIFGDTWLDTDDNDKARRWDGVSWTDYAFDVADFSLTIQKFQTADHIVGPVGTSVTDEATFGSNIARPATEPTDPLVPYADGLRDGPLGGIWVDRGAGDYGYSMSDSNGGSPTKFESFPSEVVFITNGSYGTWGVGEGLLGLETPDQTSRRVSYCFVPSGELYFSVTIDEDYVGVCSLFFTQLDNETREGTLSVDFNSQGPETIGPITVGHAQSHGRFYEFDVVVPAGVEMVLRIENMTPNNVMSGFFLGANQA